MWNKLARSPPSGFEKNNYRPYILTQATSLQITPSPDSKIPPISLDLLWTSFLVSVKNSLYLQRLYKYLNLLGFFGLKSESQVPFFRILGTLFEFPLALLSILEILVSNFQFFTLHLGFVQIYGKSTQFRSLSLRKTLASFTSTVDFGCKIYAKKCANFFLP